MSLRVCIDPGHGHSNSRWGVFDPGAVSAGVREADIVLSVGHLLRDECARRGWPSMMTRESNEQASQLRYRVSSARAFDADVIVSIHCNAAATAQAHGTETLYLASQWVAAAVQRRLVAALGLRDRGVKQRDDLAILRYERPAILVELGFITNPTERAMLLDPAVQRSAAVAIADGLAETIRP